MSTSEKIYTALRVAWRCFKYYIGVNIAYLVLAQLIVWLDYPLLKAGYIDGEGYKEMQLVAERLGGIVFRQLNFLAHLLP